jgi:hypothetical protein
VFQVSVTSTSTNESNQTSNALSHHRITVPTPVPPKFDISTGDNNENKLSTGEFSGFTSARGRQNIEIPAKTVGM